MIKLIKLLGFSVIMYQSMFCANGCDDKSLDIDAGACSLKLWSDIPISRPIIEDSLGFINNLREIDRKYGQADEFDNFVETSKIKINDSKYAKFAQECVSLFRDSSEDRKKIAIHILLEKVAQKYGKELEQLAILRARGKEFEERQELKADQTIFTDELFDMFVNADKGIPSH